jgi:hypothetical protein
LDTSSSIKQRSSLFLNLKTGKWSGKESNFQNLIFFPFMTEAIIKDSDYALKLSILKIPDNWKVNETIDCQLRAINNGNITLSSIVVLQNLIYTV